MKPNEQIGGIDINIGRDLHTDCVEKVMHAIMDKVGLANDRTLSSFIAAGGVDAASMCMMALITAPGDLKPDPDRQALAERTLFAAIFAVLSHAPDFEGVAVCVNRTKRAWEAAIGKPFDKSWLQRDIQKHLTGSVSGDK